MQSVDDVLTPLTTGFSENVLAMVVVVFVTLALYLVALPLFVWEGLAWIKSWEPVYIPGTANGNVRLHMVSDSWYTAQQLPASSQATALSKETAFWEKQVSGPIIDALSTQFRIPPANITIGKIHEVRGDVAPGANSTQKFCDVTISINAKLGDTLYAVKSMRENGDDLEKLIASNLKYAVSWMSGLKTLQVAFEASFTYVKAKGTPATIDKLNTATLTTAPPQATAGTLAAQPPVSVASAAPPAVTPLAAVAGQ